MPQKVRDVMHPGVATVRSVAFLPEAAKLMLEKDVGVLPVVDDGQIKGIITDRDITVRAVAKDKDIPQTKVADILSQHDLVTVGPDTDLQTVERLMAEKKVRRIPVVDQNQVIGIVSYSDLGRQLGTQEEGKVVEQITQPGGQHKQ